MTSHASIHRHWLSAEVRVEGSGQYLPRARHIRPLVSTPASIAPPSPTRPADVFYPGSSSFGLYSYHHPAAPDRPGMSGPSGPPLSAARRAKDPILDSHAIGKLISRVFHGIDSPAIPSTTASIGSRTLASPHMTTSSILAEADRSASDFRSDTVTVPTAAMLNAMMTASLGDNVLMDDETSHQLEQRVADMFGMEAGLFVPSGTMGNQLCIRSHLQQPPHSILCNYHAHINEHETGAIGILTQAMVRPVDAVANGLYATADEMRKYVVPRSDFLGAPTALICVENTINGVVLPLDELKRFRELADEIDVPLHMDGARILEAAAATNVPLREYGSLVDSISVCLSKGVGAPIGSVIVGKRALTQRALIFRKAVGGGMRQAGLLSAMALWCLDNVLPQLPRVHAKARAFGEWAQAAGFVLPRPVETNMVWIDLDAAAISKPALIEAGRAAGLAVLGGRFVFHWQTSDEAVEKLKHVLLQLRSK